MIHYPQTCLECYFPIALYVGGPLLTVQDNAYDGGPLMGLRDEDHAARQAAERGSKARDTFIGSGIDWAYASCCEG